MTRARRANRMLAATVLITLVAACSPTTPSQSEPAPTDIAIARSAIPAASPSGTSPADPSATSTAGPVVAPARWTDCAKGFLCADIRVPRDYAAPSGGYMDVSVIEMPATDHSHRIGSLIVDPGGPGASGVEFVRSAIQAAVFPDELRKHFDIVGFDPRGVNSSTAIRCIDNLDEQAKLDPTPDDAAQIKALVDSARNYARQCAKHNDTTLPYLSTDAVARDLDVIRAAVGDERLTYLGFSYGTLIGSLYADLFPDHIRAMVLDGAIDPAIDLRDLRLGQAKAFEGALRDFLDYCSARQTCEFYEGGKSTQAFDTLMASIDKKSLPATVIGSSRRVGPGLAWFGVLAALYSTDTWRTLATALSLAKSGDGSLLMLLADPYRGRKANGSYSNLQDAYTANTCLDYAAPTDVKVYTSWARDLAAAAPHFAPLLAYNDLPCAFWPVPAERTPKPVKAAGAPPIVVVGSTRDPATPYAWATALAKELDSGILVTREGDGHTGYQASLCVRKAVDGYLLDLVVPKDGLTCKS